MSTLDDRIKEANFPNGMADSYSDDIASTMTLDDAPAMIDRSSKSDLHGAEARDWWRTNRTSDIKTLCETMGIKFKQFTPFQFRVADQIDFYPTNGRVHFLKTNKRGNYHTAQDVKNILGKLI